MTAGVLSYMLLCRGGFVGLVSLTSSPYSSELFVLGGGWSASRVLPCVRVRRLGTFGFVWEREQVCEMLKWVNLCGVCLCLYVSKVVGK